MSGRTLNRLASAVNELAQHYNPVEYVDCDANIDYFRETLEKSPEVVIDYLLQVANELMKC